MHVNPLNGNTFSWTFRNIRLILHKTVMETCVCASVCGLVCANCWRVHICVMSEGVLVVRLMEGEVRGQGWGSLPAASESCSCFRLFSLLTSCPPPPRHTSPSSSSLEDVVRRRVAQCAQTTPTWPRWRRACWGPESLRSVARWPPAGDDTQFTLILFFKCFDPGKQMQLKCINETGFTVRKTTFYPIHTRQWWVDGMLFIKIAYVLIHLLVSLLVSSFASSQDQSLMNLPVSNWLAVCGRPSDGVPCTPKLRSASRLLHWEKRRAWESKGSAQRYESDCFKTQSFFFCLLVYPRWSPDKIPPLECNFLMYVFNMFPTSQTETLAVVWGHKKKKTKSKETQILFKVSVAAMAIAFFSPRAQLQDSPIVSLRSGPVVSPESG